jgi:hypothetical protein
MKTSRATYLPHPSRAVSPTIGFDEQISGGDEQIPGRGQTYLSDISLKVIWEKQRTSTFSHHRRVKRLNSIRSAN